VNDKPPWVKFEQLLHGEVMVSIINEVDFVVDEPKAESALERARHRWFERKDHERE
jgi:hypothetical protein